MIKNIKYLIEDYISFNPHVLLDDMPKSKLPTNIITEIIGPYPKTKNELKQIIVERFNKNPENPYLLDVDTSQITDMSELFSFFTEIKELDLHTWNTSNVTSMEKMFQSCKNLTKLDISGFDTSSVTDMSLMFFNCFNLVEQDLSNFNTTSVTHMYCMFSNCLCLNKLNIKSFEMLNVIDIAGMFEECHSLRDIDFSNVILNSNCLRLGMLKNCPRKTQNLFKKQVTIKDE